MRTIGNINQDIERCKKQIAATYEADLYPNQDDMMITRQGFQQQLNNLINERSQYIRNIEVINPRVVVAYEPSESLPSYQNSSNNNLNH